MLPAEELVLDKSKKYGSAEYKHNDPKLAKEMYDILMTMSQERNLNMTPLEIIHSSYLGCNLVYNKNLECGE